MLDWVSPALKFIQVVPGLSVWLGPTLKRRQVALVAGDLAELVFWKDEVLGPLNRFVAGKGTRDNLDALAQALENSKSRVNNAVKRLEARLQTVIAPNFGIETSMALWELIHWKCPHNVQSLRLELCCFIELAGGRAPKGFRLEPGPNQTYQTLMEHKGGQRAYAKRLVELITLYNKAVIRMHDIIRQKLN